MNIFKAGDNIYLILLLYSPDKYIYSFIPNS